MTDNMYILTCFMFSLCACFTVAFASLCFEELAEMKKNNIYIPMFTPHFLFSFLMSSVMLYFMMSH